MALCPLTSTQVLEFLPLNKWTECPNRNLLKNVSSYHWKLLKLKGRLDTITERMTKSGTLEPYTTYMDEDSTDKIDKFLLMSQVKPLESDDDDMDLDKIV